MTQGKHPGHKAAALERIYAARDHYASRAARRAKQIFVPQSTECFHSARQDCAEDFVDHHIITPAHWEKLPA